MRVRLLYVHLLFVSVRALFSSVVILLVSVGDDEACVRSAFVYVHARFGVARMRPGATRACAYVCTVFVRAALCEGAGLTGLGVVAESAETSRRDKNR